MTFDINKALQGPPDVVLSADDVIGSGMALRCEDKVPHLALNNSPVTYVSTALMNRLNSALPHDEPWPLNSENLRKAGRYAMLRVLAAMAVDSSKLPNAEEGDLEDGLYITPAVPRITGEDAVWFLRNGDNGPITACLPSDY